MTNINLTLAAADYTAAQAFAKTLVSTDKIRTKLHAVHYRVNRDTLTVTVTDGYRGGQATFTLAEPTDTTGTALLPLLPKLPKGERAAVLIISASHVTVGTTSGTQTMPLPPQEGYPEDKIVAAATEHKAQFRLLVKPATLIATLQAFAEHKAVTLEFTGELSPILIKSEDDDKNARAFAMPMRRN